MTNTFFGSNNSRQPCCHVVLRWFLLLIAIEYSLQIPELYGTTGKLGSFSDLYRIDLVNGRGSFVGPVRVQGLGVLVSGIAFDRSQLGALGTGRMFGITSGRSINFANRLIEIDLANGGATIVGTLTIGGLQDLGIDELFGQIYSWKIRTGQVSELVFSGICHF